MVNKYIEKINNIFIELNEIIMEMEEEEKEYLSKFKVVDADYCKMMFQQANKKTKNNLLTK